MARDPQTLGTWGPAFDPRATAVTENRAGSPAPAATPRPPARPADDEPTRPPEWRFRQMGQLLRLAQLEAGITPGDAQRTLDRARAEARSMPVDGPTVEQRRVLALCDRYDPR